MNARQYLALPLAFVGGVLLAQSSGCVEPDPNHCTNNGGDDYCAQQHPDWEQAFCSNNCGDYEPDGCVQEQPDASCWACDGKGSSNCDEGTTISDESDSSDTADTESSEEDPTDSTDTMTTGPECMDSSECGEGTPLCDGGMCVECGDAVNVDCAGEYPGAPVCDEGSGGCVECTEGNVGACSDEAPACENFECVPCTEHDQCPTSACNMVTGACIAEERVWWVDQTVANSGNGSEGMPYETLAEAMEWIGDGEEGVIYLKTPNDHQEQLVVVPGQTVALIGKSEIGALRNNLSSAIDSEGIVFVHDVRIVGGGAGVDCGQGRLWITDSLVSTLGRGVNVDGCDGVIRRSRIVNNSQTSIRLVDGMLRVESSFVGGDVSDQFSIDVGLTGALDMVYSTVVAGFGNAAAIRCSNNGTGSVVRDSVLVARTMNAEVSACAEMDIANSAVEADMANNVSLGEMNVMWFANLAGGDFHLSANAPAALSTAATWQTGDPKTDIDSDLRPTTDGTADYAGADIPN